LKANEKENRIVPIDEYMKYMDKDKKINPPIREGNSSSNGTNNKDNSIGKDMNETYDKNRNQADLMRNVANSIQNIMDDSDKGRKTNIERALDENKAKRRNNGMSR
jgi:hypothetical protein